MSLITLSSFRVSVSSSDEVSARCSRKFLFSLQIPSPHCKICKLKIYTWKIHMLHFMAYWVPQILFFSSSPHSGLTSLKLENCSQTEADSSTDHRVVETCPASQPTHSAHCTHRVTLLHGLMGDHGLRPLPSQPHTARRWEQSFMHHYTAQHFMKALCLPPCRSVSQSRYHQITYRILIIQNLGEQEASENYT